MPVSPHRAPAKLNLSLEITGVRPDGYHLVDTWLVTLPGLFDDVALRPRPAGSGIAVRCPAAPALEGPDNLAARAAVAWAAAAGAGLDLEIVIEKRIPIAAGLGGGSSDAGAVLRMLEAQRGALGPARLAELAATLGADVPFFLAGGPARATGIGERLAPAPAPAWPWAAAAKPAPGLRTADVYRRYDERAREGALRPARGPYFNDLEPAALDLCPEIAGVLAVLRAAGARVAQVSGSGSACFGLFATEAEARHAAAALARAGYWSAASPVGGSA